MSSIAITLILLAFPAVPKASNRSRHRSRMASIEGLHIYGSDGVLTLEATDGNMLTRVRVADVVSDDGAIAGKDSAGA